LIDKLQDQGEFRWQMEGDRVCILSADGSEIEDLKPLKMK
jgi:hypothetical protein